MKMSKAAMTRLKKSDFWVEVLEVTKAWDFYLHAERPDFSAKMGAAFDVASVETSARLSVIKKALTHITGKHYTFVSTDDDYMLVDPNDPTDILLEGKRYKPSDDD